MRRKAGAGNVTGATCGPSKSGEMTMPPHMILSGEEYRIQEMTPSAIRRNGTLLLTAWPRTKLKTGDARTCHKPDQQAGKKAAARGREKKNQVAGRSNRTKIRDSISRPILL